MKDFTHFPINIALSQGCYSIELKIGSQKSLVNLLIDTGSSTLVFNDTVYSPTKDKHVKYSQFAQCVTYGKGGWAGPVLKSSVIYSNKSQQIEVTNAPFSIVMNQQENSFLGLDGILGLAYHHLNKAYDLNSYFKNKITNTYPWTFTNEVKKNGITAFKNFLRKFPEQDITPIFTELEEQNIVPNTFTLLTHRSIVYVPNANMSLEQKKQEGLNKGLLIIGHLKKYKQGLLNSRNVKVLHDAYYNTNLVSVQVEGFKPFLAPKLDTPHLNTFFTNAIVDSGSSYLMLQTQIYQYIIDCFGKLNPKLLSHVDSFHQSRKDNKPYFAADFKLLDWPSIYFTLTGSDEDTVKLCCKADHYWQLHASSPNQLFFTLLNQIEKWPNQSIIGLPIISSYLCVFDRSAGTDGVIKFIDK